MPARSCLVSAVDFRGIRHTAEVQAETVFEAVILGVKQLRAEEWSEPIGPSTPLEVEVKEPSNRHTLTLKHVERWLAGAVGDPRDQVKKAKLRMLLLKV